jgi:magnesium transporter
MGELVMNPEKLLKEVRQNLEALKKQEIPLGKFLWESFIELHPADIAKFLTELRQEDFKQILQNLPREKLCAIFAELSESMQVIALDLLNDMSRIDALNCLTTDQMTDLFENLSDNDLKKYLDLLHKKDREAVLSLLKFDPESAGGIMDTEVLALHEDFSVKKGIELIQRLDVKRDLHQRIFIINDKKQLVGFINLEDLVLQKPLTRIKEFMHDNEFIVLADEDQEQIAKKMVHYNLTIAPVVSKDNYFLGIIPSSTVIDVIEEEASEDVYRMSAMEPVKGTYFEMPFFKLLYQRSYILIILLLAQSLSSSIMMHYQDLLTGFLMLFTTMLISTGGNASSQTSAIIIQGMASGEINKSNMRRFFKRELLLAFSMAFILGITAFSRVYVTSGNILGSFVVSMALGSIVIVSMSIGSVIPVLLKRLNIDPAYSAGPFLTTLIDILGLLIYCNVSKLFFLA